VDGFLVAFLVGLSGGLTNRAHESIIEKIVLRECASSLIHKYDKIINFSRYRKSKFVLNEPWKNLIVLDACRYDLFKNYNTISGNLKKINSAGSHTEEWFKNNFVGKKCRDIIYISANPQISNYFINKRYGYNPFLKVVDVWKDKWSDELGTVCPERVNEVTLENLKIHPEKKYIIHYMQPHFPFIGEFKIENDIMTLGRKKILRNQNKSERVIKTPWYLASNKLIDINKVIKAHISNLKLVLNTIEKLLPNLIGKTIITSDHGNLFGEIAHPLLPFKMYMYGHPSHFHVKKLVEVPWLEVKI